MQSMRIAAVVLFLFTLGACAEVTTFRRPDGSTFHHVNCGDTLKLESCRSAAGRTCPNGFSPMSISTSNDDSPTQRCVNENAERRRNREPELACPPVLRKDNYFICK
jgi:hypothetical protein